jgi:HK97 family phage prohead protease
MNIIRKTSFSEIEDGREGVFSDWRVIDAMDDQVGDGTVESWDLKNFEANPMVLVGHQSSFVGGRASNTHVDKDGVLRGRIHLASPSTSPRHAELHALVNANPPLLRGISVGFFPLESRPRPGSKSGGQIYSKCRLAEVSICAIPANPAALLKAKALGCVSREVLDMFSKTEVTAAAERLRDTRRAIRVIKERLPTITDQRTRNSLQRSLVNLEKADREMTAQLQGKAPPQQQTQTRTRHYTQREADAVAEKARALLGPMNAAVHAQRLAREERTANFTATTKKLQADFELRKQLEQEELDSESRRLFGKDDTETRRYNWDKPLTWRGQRIDVPKWRWGK